MRQAVADRFRGRVVTELRCERPDLVINLHANPYPHRSSSFTGVDMRTAASLVDGLVVNCWQDFSAIPANLASPASLAGAASTAGTASPTNAARVHASLLAVEAMGGRRRTLVDQALEARAAGAGGIRLYHAGLASDADLAAIREVCRA